MSKELPPLDGIHFDGSTEVGNAKFDASASNDVESERSMTARELASSDKEFEFSHLVLDEQLPFALPQDRIDRTWARLSQASVSKVGLVSVSHQRKRLTGPLVAFAACAATFAAGVWVGEGNGGLRGSGLASQRVMTAEPIGITLPSGNDLDNGLDDNRLQDNGLQDNGLHHNGRAAERLEVGQESAAVVRTSTDAPVGHARPAGSPVGDTTRLTQGVLQAVNLTLPPSADVPALPPPVHTSDVAGGVNAAGAGAPGWQRLANDGDYEGALVEIAAGGGFERILQTSSAEQLMLLSDVARGTGQQQRALAALRRIVSEHASDPVAPLAALNMGNLLDKMGDGAAATQAFAVYRALSPQGEFAEDAFVRELRSAVSAGQQDVARRLVRQYETDFPEGRRADEVARWAEQIPTQSESGDAGTAFSEASQ